MSDSASVLLGAVIGYALAQCIIAAWYLRDEILDRIVPSRRRARREAQEATEKAVRDLATTILTRYKPGTLLRRRPRG